jgi:hypothetical protein
MTLDDSPQFDGQRVEPIDEQSTADELSTFLLDLGQPNHGVEEARCEGARARRRDVVTRLEVIQSYYTIMSYSIVE